jgi:hypothetical protein
MTLFVKGGCKKCDYVKQAIGIDRLKELGVNIEELSPPTVETLAHLAWHELVSVAETALPILVLDDCTAITGAINIKNKLEEM